MSAQYNEWGVVVQTSKVRGVHIANGFVQLLRLFPQPPAWESGKVDPGAYEKSVTKALTARYGADPGAWKLSDAARALCVTTTKEGPLSLAVPSSGEPEFMAAGRSHVGRFLELEFDAASTGKVHATVAAALNADGAVYAAGGSDPTTPTLRFGGYTSTHTLKGMHAATFLGLLCKTPAGAQIARELYGLLRREDDPHTQLIRRLQLEVDVVARAESGFENAYPVPEGSSWDDLAARTARLAGRLLSWSRESASKPDALMAIVDLASLILFLRLLQWRPPGGGPRPLLLMVSPARRRVSEAVVRAQQTLRAACATLDAFAERLDADREEEVDDEDRRKYQPSLHARNLGAAGGWLFPLDSRGAPKRWLCPGPRQLATLVHSLLDPGEEIAWPSFAARAAEEFGIVVGGVNEARLATELGLGGGANSVREAGRLNREHLVAVGLARQESDNVILVDGGGK